MLGTLLEDEWLDIRVVAAESIALLGEREAAANTMNHVLKNGNQYEVLAAQNAIDFMCKTGSISLSQAQALVRDKQFAEPANRIPRYLLSQPN